MSCHDHAVALSTAPTFRQVRHILWKEVHRRYRNAKYDLGGKLLDTRLEMPERDSFAMGLSADSPDEFQGFHSANMLIVVDEAEGVAEPIYEAIEALMTSENCRLLLIGNPTTVTGSFRRAFHEDREAVPHHNYIRLRQPQRDSRHQDSSWAGDRQVGGTTAQDMGRGQPHIPGQGCWVSSQNSRKTL